jgi:hypothetical protein
LDYDHDPVSRLLRARTGHVGAGGEEVTVVRQVTRAFSSADEVLGGGHGLSSVATYFTDAVVPLLSSRFASGKSRADAFAAAAELAWLLGWKHHDLAHEGAAQRYYLLGYQLAVEADPHAHAAWMMRAVAHQALSLRQPGTAVASWNRALDLAEGMAYARTRSALAAIGSPLATYRRRGVPGAAQLMQRLRHARI